MTTSPSDDLGDVRSLFHDVMIDIESMSLHPHNALILSVGMCEFDPSSSGQGPRIGKSRLLVPDIAEQLMLGREVSASTQAWWKTQPKEASAHWLDPIGETTCSPLDVIANLREFCEGRQRVWANGTQFDLSNLVELKAQLEARDNRLSPGPLWFYRAPRDMRTFCEETIVTRVVDRDHYEAFRHDNTIIDHHPVSDCFTQAWRVWEHYRQ